MGTPTKYENPVEPNKVEPNNSPAEMPNETTPEQPGVSEATATGNTEADLNKATEAEPIDYSI